MGSAWWVGVVLAQTVARPSPPAEMEVFVSPGCPRCAEAETFIASLQRERSGLHVVIHDIVADPAARARLQALANENNAHPMGVPAFQARGRLIIGYDGSTLARQRLIALLDGTTEPPSPSDANAICRPEAIDACAPATAADATLEEVELPWLGRVSVDAVGLPLFTLAIGLLDGFNPCAMWVLLFLLSLLVNLRERRRMILIAGTFVLASGLVYFAFMAAWLNLFLLIGLSRAVQLILAGLAGIVGFINLKDFFAFKRGLSLGIPDAAKPGLYARTRRILYAEHLTGALLGAIVLAVLVNMIELACTAGFPAVYTHILAQRSLAAWAYYGYLTLYNLAYIADDTLMVAIAVVTLAQRKLKERGGRWLKLISGAVMLGLAAYLVAEPLL